MKEILKQSMGIDCSKNDFAVTFSISDENMNIKHVRSKVFLNTAKGFNEFVKWQQKLSSPQMYLPFVMEATGVYHERLACFLVGQGKFVSVVFPNRAKAFSKTLEVKTVTDKEASKSLSVMGLERKLNQWEKPDPLYHSIKKLTRERERYQKHKTAAMNELHAEQSGEWNCDKTTRRLKQQIKLLEKQIVEIESELKNLVNENSQLAEKVSNITSIPGVGEITALTVIGETNGFKAIVNKRQLVSYAGFDVIEKTSGISVKSKARISKKGNRHIRKALYMPALSSIRFNEDYKQLFARLVSKHGIKKKAIVAVQRKCLILIYTLWKYNTEFIPDYSNKNRAE